MFSRNLIGLRYFTANLRSTFGRRGYSFFTTTNLYSKQQRSSLFNRFKTSSKRSNSTNRTTRKPTGIKALMQEYGYSALGVYLGLSCIDLPLCFLLVHSQGEEKIRMYQDKVMGWVGFGSGKKHDFSDEVDANEGKDDKKSSTLLTEFAVAYAIHKSLIFIRLPITAAITPAIVKKLRSMGFNVGNLHKATRDSIKEHGLKKTFTPSGAKNVTRDMKEASLKDPAGLNNPRFGKKAGTGSRWFF